MNLKLIRTSMQEDFTTGVLYVGNEMLAHTLEPKSRDLTTEPKVYGHTAVPPGSYRIMLAVSARFKRKMPYLLDVSHFSGVMFHPGNTVDDTQGCILVGERAGQKGVLKNSRIAFGKLYTLLEEASIAGEAIILTIC